jgi:hypothetical protein
MAILISCELAKFKPILTDELCPAAIDALLSKGPESTPFYPQPTETAELHN